MTPQMTLDLFADALWLVVILVTVIILPSLLVGLLISMFQAATQINEQTLSFLPRLIITLAMVMWAGPWIVTRLLDHFRMIFEAIPQLIGTG
ncbi:flagellar export apparatus protein FliQ [Marinobacterium nitratireducens]|uniref:Flagellar biosynthetic protein FliQ n=1 Tax=Marinobacterium nitratireducens TaxID=518897 RepID=A0A917ZMJ4_9GAMM|nr:flagellar biosynthesis protein FliQ [Marinobacterium nitratireducens]GGO85010.1 flagellar export apparatus protein FliQ [Marinobacterium nitratireducens]